jgi:hypothetical protein
MPICGASARAAHGAGHGAARGGVRTPPDGGGFALYAGELARVYSFMLLFTHMDDDFLPLRDFRGPVAEDEVCHFALISGREVHEEVVLPALAREEVRALAMRLAGQSTPYRASWWGEPRDASRDGVY